jgi:hypothetical protein
LSKQSNITPYKTTTRFLREAEKIGHAANGTVIIVVLENEQRDFP